DAAPDDLQGHPHGLAPRRLHHLLRHVADDADITVAGLRVLARWIGDRVDVGARDVERRPVGPELRDRSERRLNDHDRVRGIDLLQPPVRAYEAVWTDPVRAAERVARLVDALVGRKRRVTLDTVG